MVNKLLKIASKIIYSYGKINPDDLNPKNSGWINPRGEIIDIDDMEHSDFIINYLKFSDDALDAFDMGIGQSVIDEALEQKWTRFFGGRSNSIGANDKHSIYVETKNIPLVKRVLRKSGYPFDSIYVNDKKYDFERFIK